MRNKIRPEITLALLISLLFCCWVAAPAAASRGCEPKIKEVFFPGDDTVQIIGTCLEDGSGATVVRLGTEGTIAVAAQGRREIIAEIPAELPDGNYRVTVAHRGGKSRWLAALDTSDTQGPPGRDGRDLTNELCVLYALTNQLAPQSLVTESPELTCDDNRDNDCNGLTDAADASCSSNPPMCTVAEECEIPANICEEAVCDSGTCRKENRPNGTQCGPSGICQNGLCVPAM